MRPGRVRGRRLGLRREIPGEPVARDAGDGILRRPVERSRRNGEVRRREDLELEARGLAAVVVDLDIPTVRDETEHAHLGIEGVARQQTRQLYGTRVLERE